MNALAEPKIWIDVTATITINSREAQVLSHLTSYSLAEWFAVHCNCREIPEKEIKDTLNSLRGQLSRILVVKDAAVRAINKE